MNPLSKNSIINGIAEVKYSYLCCYFYFVATVDITFSHITHTYINEYIHRHKFVMPQKCNEEKIAKTISYC